MEWSAKNDKTRNSRFYDLRIVGYKKLQNKNLGYQKSVQLIKILQNVSFSTQQFSDHKISNFSFCRFELDTPFTHTTNSTQFVGNKCRASDF